MAVALQHGRASGPAIFASGPWPRTPPTQDRRDKMADDQTDPRRNPWTTLRIAEKYANPWITVEEHDVLTPKGKPGIYGVVRPRNLAIGVLPLDARGMTTLVGQYRYPHDRYSWEMPEGGGDKRVAPID